jgi:2,2-dialkylglycine decarboxylase (pyruvate)
VIHPDLLELLEEGGGGTNAEWLERANRVLVKSRYLTDKVLAQSRGVRVTDVEGREYIDFESGQVCMATGHAHPYVLDVLQRQSGRLMQIGSNFTSREEILLAEALRERAPQDDAHVYLSSTGSDSNEAALRLAKKATGRFEIVAVIGGYHGQTQGSWSVTTHTEGSLKGYGPTTPGTVYVPTPNPYHCRYCADRGGCSLACAAAAEEIIDRTTSGFPAAFIL